MVAIASEEYKEAVSSMPRSRLEEFVFQAAKTMEDLEHENAQLSMDIDDVKKIDVEVIQGWREWSQSLDEEREKWAALATDLSAEKHLLHEEHNKALVTIEDLLRTIGDLEITAIEHSKEGTKTLQLRAGYKKIIKMMQETVDRYSRTGEESESEFSQKDSFNEA